MTANEGMPLEVTAASKSYGEVKALDDVSFAVTGGIFGLLGANGAGKSTLFQAILHLIELDAGTIAVHGLEVRSHSVEVRRKVGFLPEEPQLYTRLTGNELLRFVAGLKNIDNSKTLESIREMMADFELEAHSDQLIAGYSLGMRKKVALIVALMGAPELVLLDEPLNGLDTEHMRRLRLRIEAMASAGTTFVISSHAMAFVERVCARMAILRRGRLAALGTAAELRAQAGLGDGVPFEDVFLELATPGR